MSETPERKTSTRRTPGSTTPQSRTFDDVVASASTTSVPSKASAGSYQEALAELRAARREALKEVSATPKTSLEKVRATGVAAGRENGVPGPIQTILNGLGVIPASIATVATLGDEDYLVGETGFEDTIRPLSEMSLRERVTSKDQLGIGDAFKSWFTDEETQREYLLNEADRATNWAMTGLETAGVVGDLILDPLNLIGGVGLYDDGFKALGKGARLVAVEEALAKKSGGAVDAALAVTRKYGDDVERLTAELAEGTIDDATAAAAKKAAADEFVEAYGKLNGQAVLEGDHTLANARFFKAGVSRSAPRSAKMRTSYVTDRLTEIYKDVARYKGVDVAEASLETLPGFGGRNFGRIVSDVHAQGFSALEAEGRNALGVGGRLWRTGVDDFTSGRAFNPFSESASKMGAIPDRSYKSGPLVALRRAAYGAENDLTRTSARLVSPAWSRSGKLWRAALAMTTDSASAKEDALRIWARETGEELSEEAAEQLAAYPITALTQANLDGITRAAGKRLLRAARASQQEIASILEREDPADWVLAGTNNVGINQSWDAATQSALEAADRDGSLRAGIGQAIYDAFVRADIPVHLPQFLDGDGAAAGAAKVFRMLTNDPDFGADLARVAYEAGEKLTTKGLDVSDLARAALNATTHLASNLIETDGMFSWANTLSHHNTAVALFSISGSEMIGRAAKVASILADLGLAVVNDLPTDQMSTKQLHELINTTAQRFTDILPVQREAYEKVAQARYELLQALRRKGVSETQLAEFEAQLVEDRVDRPMLQRILNEASEAARGFSDDAKEATQRLAAEQRALRDFEEIAGKLEKVHAALNDFRSASADLEERVIQMSEAATLLDNVTMNLSPLRTRLEMLLEPVGETATRAWKADIPGRAHLRRGAMLAGMIGALDDAGADAAGRFGQGFNEFVRYARELFAGTPDLEKLADHSEATRYLTGGWGMTAGAWNRQTVKNLFEERAHPLLQEWAETQGGWNVVFGAGNEATVEQLLRLGRKAQRLANKETPRSFSSIGLAKKDMARFLYGRMVEGFDALLPILEVTTRFLADGTGVDDLNRLFVGELGGEALNALTSGDLRYLDTLFRQAARSVDLANDFAGGFASPDGFTLVRQAIQENPEMVNTLQAMLDQLSALDNAADILKLKAYASDTSQHAIKQVEDIYRVAPPGADDALVGQRGELVDRLIGDEFTDIGARVEDAAEKAAQARAIVGSAKKAIGETRRELSVVARRIPRLEAARVKVINDLTVQEMYLDLLDEKIVEGIPVQIATAARMAAEVQLMGDAPAAAAVFTASRDFQVVAAGQEAFFSDPKVFNKLNSAGEVVARSEREMDTMWRRRLEGAEKWVETLRERAVTGYMSGGENPRFVAPVTRYSEYGRQLQEWTQARAEEGFSTIWNGVALADHGAASAFVTLMTGTPRFERSTTGATFDYLMAAMKAQYVGRASFTTGNLISAIQENVIQGVNLLKSRKVWATDNRILELQALGRYAGTLDGPEAAKVYGLIDSLEKRVRAEVGDDMFDLVMEARDVGVASTSLFGETAGRVAEGPEVGWRRSIKEAWQVGRNTDEAEFGYTPVRSTFAAATRAVGEIPSWPARKFERKLSRGLSRTASGGTWHGLVDDPTELAALRALSDLAEPFVEFADVESLVRVDLYVQRRLAGDDELMAFLRVADSHFDYSDMSAIDLTMRRIFPFWIWRSRSVAHYGEMIAHRPVVAKMVLSPNGVDRRNRDDRAPYYAQEFGGNFDPAMGIGLNLRPPAGDFAKLFETVAEDGPWQAAKDFVEGDTFALYQLPYTLVGGRGPSGRPINGKASIQGPLSAIASAPGGRQFVSIFAKEEKGDWYWRNPAASHAFGELLPLLSNVTAVTGPWQDGDGMSEKAFGAAGRVFGLPVRVVSDEEMARAQRYAAVRRRTEAEKNR